MSHRIYDYRYGTILIIHECVLSMLAQYEFNTSVIFPQIKGCTDIVEKYYTEMGLKNFGVMDEEVTLKNLIL